MSYKRACLLTSHAGKLNSPCLVVTNHEAQRFPTHLHIDAAAAAGAAELWPSTQQDSKSGAAAGAKQPALSVSASASSAAVPVRLQFDRVLCDVPCSGDGTMRKLPRAALQQWSPAFGSALHQTQVRF
jgi:16S rRNA C967 or C1407 C5-methylase (RsmB/RsmF family)